MKKDVIYIDIEDDITSVIEKIKNSPENIIALVPPKGSAVLQSVVNLKLVKRAATAAKKQPVLITNNQALLALAGGIGMYVAKNLQTKPAIPNGDTEVADDESLEVSEEVGSLDDEKGTTVDLKEKDDDSEVELSEEELTALDDPEDEEVVAPKKSEKKANKKANKNAIPNFNSFRKKLLLIGGGIIVLLIVLLTVFGRTKAAVVIRAETTPVDVAVELAVSADAAQSDIANRAIKAKVQEVKRTASQTFTATGEKDLGSKASGDITLRNCSTSENSVTIPAGTGVSANNLTFITPEAVRLPASIFTGGGNCITPTRKVTVTAQNNGDQYNLSPRTYTVNGFSSVRAGGEQMRGGKTEIVKVVSQADIDKAKEQMNQQDTSALRNELKAGFGEGATILDDTFSVTFGNVVSEPAVDQEANEAQLTAEITYSMLAIDNNDLGAVLDGAVSEQMTNQDQQRVYQNGIENMKLEKLSGDARNVSYRVSALGYYGPQFDERNLKEQITGKKVGEVRSYLQDLPGVKSVDISLSPFWARNAPNPDRIEVTLDVDDR